MNLRLPDLGLRSTSATRRVCRSLKFNEKSMFYNIRMCSRRNRSIHRMAGINVKSLIWTGWLLRSHSSILPCVFQRERGGEQDVKNPRRNHDFFLFLFLASTILHSESWGRKTIDRANHDDGEETKELKTGKAIVWTRGSKFNKSTKLFRSSLTKERREGEGYGGSKWEH